MNRNDFTKFFMAVNDGHAPFRWQERLLDTVLKNGRWPDRIAAPTGAGKTSAIDVHVFATALTTVTGGPRLPRRLIMVVDRRVLVDDQYQRARQLREALESPESALPPEVAEVAGVLKALSRLDGKANPEAPALVTARLRGGSVPSRSWRDYPTACAVLCATPDMWGSRLLFRGYGTSSATASQEAGMLAFDSAVLVDEAHLSRQLLVTAHRVADLVQVADQPVKQVPTLQVVEVTATPTTTTARAALTTVAVDKDDLAEEHLDARLTRPKPTTLLEVSEWPHSRQTGKIAAKIARAVTAMHGQVASGDPAATVGCYVNTVPMALAVRDALRDETLRVVTVCGQVRPADLDRLRSEYDGILSTRGNPNVDVIVTTQSLEVGADLDLAGIVTELASGSALAQRAGRVNRLGKRKSGPVTVIVPTGPVTDKMHSGPYSWYELETALAWVAARAAEPMGLAPWALREFAPPPAGQRRTLYQRPEIGDAWHWARTSDDLAAEPELDLWLSDSLEEDTSVGIVVRDALPDDPTDAVEFARDLPPAPWEVFPVPYRTAQRILAELIANEKVVVRLRGEDAAPMRSRTSGDADVRPGDFAMIDSSSELFTRAVVHVFSPPVVVQSNSTDDSDADAVDATRRGRAEDVLHFQAAPHPGSIRLRIEWSSSHEQVAGFARDTARRLLSDFAENFKQSSERSRRDSLAALLKSVPDGEYPDDLRRVIAAVITLLKRGIKDSDVILRQAEDGSLTRVVVLDGRKAVADEDLRQVFTPNDKDPVLLSNHQRDVAARAVLLATGLQLPVELSDALRIAGAHHDDGKADRRFQIARLGAEGDGEPLAKSVPGKTIRAVRKDQALAGLPVRWRHEQRSIVDSWAGVLAEPAIDHDLALRLIGTSHGRGRSGFPHSSAELAGPEDTADWHSLAAELFDAGGWDELIEATQIRYGVWGCAYLEAVLRAADCQVSGEGR